MKTPSDQLFQLIKSLNTREKHYFKTHVGKGTGKIMYMKLFDIINDQKAGNYDEEGVRQKLGNNSQIKNLKHSKSRLSEALMKCLEKYYADDRGDTQIQRLLHQADILDKKKLNKASAQILLKAERLCIEYEKYDHLLVVLSKKARHFRINGDVDRLKKFIRSDVGKEQDYIARLQNQIGYRNILNAVNIIITQYNSVVGNKELESKIEEVRQHSLLSSPKKALTYNSLRYYYYILFDCTLLTRQYDEKAYTDAKQWVKLVEAKKQLDPNYDDNYLVALSHLLINQKNQNKDFEMEETYEKVKEFYFSLTTKRKNNFLMSLFISITSNYISSLTTMGMIEKAVKTWENISGFIVFKIISNSSQTILAGNLAFTYFLLGKYHEALRWTNFILNNSSDSIKRDVQIEMRIIALVLHYELKNYGVLKYLAKSTHAYFTKVGRLGPFEKTQMIFFEQEIHLAKSRREVLELFTNLKSRLEKIMKKQSINYVFDFIIWLESKIENRPLIEVMREKGKVFGSG